MAGWNGIFYNGVWSLGFDFMPNGAVTPSNIFNSATSNSTGDVNATHAATAGKGLQLAQGSAVGRTLGVHLAHLYMGFHWSTDALPATTNAILTLYDSVAAASQFCLGYDSQGRIGFYASGGQTASAALGAPSSAFQLSPTLVIVPATQYFIEVYMSVATSGGQLTVRINGLTAATFTGNTQATANAWIDQVFLSNCASSAVNVTFDNLYMLDTTGAAPLNTFLGPGRIQTDGPNGESATQGLNAWTPTTPQGTDYGNCANIPANSSDYNSSATIGQRMSLSFPAITNGVQALFLNTWFSVEEDASGSRTLSAIYRNTGTDQVGPTTFTLTTTYQYFNQPSTVDPVSGLPWSTFPVTNAAGCEIGLEVAT